MEAVQLATETPRQATKQRRPHTHNPSSALILKSAIISKKCNGFILGNTYKPCLFELLTNGQLYYYELKPNGQKIKKGDISITSSTRIEKRYGGKRRDEKFIIHSNNRSYYLWCNHTPKTHRNTYKKPCITPKPCNAIYKHSFNPKPHMSNTPKFSQNSICLSSDKNKTLYPYPYLSKMTAKPCNSSLIRIQTPSKDSDESPLNSVENYTKQSGKTQALEWCDILLNIVAQKKREKEFDTLVQNNMGQSVPKIQRVRSNSCPLKNYRSNEFVGNETEYEENAIWTLKESYLWSKDEGYGSDEYSLKYFILRLNGKLDCYLDKDRRQKIGSVDILHSCINIEKRKGSQRRDCQWIVFTRQRNYYFWGKDNKQLSEEWYHLLRLILSEKIKEYNAQIEIGVHYRKNSSAHHSLSVTNFEEYQCSNDVSDSDGFVPQLFCSDIYGQYMSVLVCGENMNDSSKIKRIHQWLPLSYTCYDWELLYSSDIDGYSMITFYEKCRESGPSILIIKDENGYIFGVFLSESMSLENKLFFGNGETFVFNVCPKMSKYKWNGMNRFFMHCKMDTLTFGGGDNGHSALVLTDNFRYGISQKSQTFNNEVLSKNVDFSPCVVEVWTFKNYW